MTQTTTNIDLLLIVLLSIVTLTLTARPDKRGDCVGIGNIIKSKGFSYPWWEEGRGPVEKSLSNSGCPARGKTIKCCPSSFDTGVEKREIGTAFSQKWLGQKLGAAKEIYGERKKKFDLTFKALLQRAHTSFHSMFERTYGMLYIQHAHVFHSLFKTLESYYEDGRDPLESRLNEFFAILTRKMFEVLNAQYDFSESYLSCATIVISEKQGNDLHRQIVSSLRRSFVATRAFAQGLSEAEKVIASISRLPLNPSDCLIPLAQMLHCPVCAENRAYKPCMPYCTSITAKCLFSTGALGKHWQEFSRALEDLIDRLLGPYNVEAVVEPIHIKISEAIMNFQESGNDLSVAVFAKCGKPTLKSRGFAKREAKAAQNPIKPLAQTGPADEESGKSLEKILKDTKGRVRKSKDFWNVLPRQVCNAISKDYSSQMCWNGSVALKMEKNQKDGGDEGGSLNLFESLSKGPSNPLINEQILALQSITEKLKTAFNGGDIQWISETVDIDDDLDGGSGMGSGSGDMPTDLEDTDDDDPGGEIKFNNKKQGGSSDRLPIKSDDEIIPHKPSNENTGFRQTGHDNSPFRPPNNGGDNNNGFKLPVGITENTPFNKPSMNEKSNGLRPPLESGETSPPEQPNLPSSPFRPSGENSNLPIKPDLGSSPKKAFSPSEEVIGEEDEDEEEEEEEEDDDDDNLNISSVGKNSNNNNDFGIDSPPQEPSPPRVQYYPPIPATTTTTTSTSTTTTTTTTSTTTRRPSTIKITPPPYRPPNIVPEHLPTPSIVIKDERAVKTVAVVNVFTPVIMSMLQKLFNFG